MKCGICKSSNLFNFLSLGHQPPSDAFLTMEELGKPETYYPMDMYFCENCNLVQLGYIVDPKVLFHEGYVYSTSSNKDLIKNFNELTKMLVDRFSLSGNDLAIDIGSNDGTLLSGYKGSGVKVLGIEPTANADRAIASSIPTLRRFFNRDTADFVSKVYGKAKMITATNVFAHVDDVHEFMESIKLILSDNGVFVSESHHLLSLINEMQYDSFYHEHLRNYSVKPLINLFNLHDMDIFDVEMISSHGGSIRVFACHKGIYPILDSVNNVINIETKAGLYDKKTFVDYAKKVENCRDDLKDLLFKLKREGKEVVGIGAPAKGNTLLNYFNIRGEVSCLLETSPLKIGMYSPGCHIPVVDEKYLFEKNPEYGLLLSWNIKDIIIPKLREKGYTGKIIVPVPTLHITE